MVNEHRRSTTRRRTRSGALIAFGLTLWAAAPARAQHAGARVTPASPRPPVVFEETGNQATARATFVARGTQYTLFLSADEALLTLRKSPAAAVRMRLTGASRSPALSGVEPLPGKIYYVDGTSDGRLTPRNTYRRVKSTGVYPGVDLDYYGNDRQLEFDFVVAPDGDASRIRLAFAGAD